MAARSVRSPWPRPAIALSVAALCLALLAREVLTLPQSGDYHLPGVVGGDNAGPGIAALLHGSLPGYVDHQPIIGLTSILLRLPVAWLAVHLGAGNLRVYQWGALACMVPLALLGAWLVAAPGLEPRQRVLRLLAVLIVVANPILSQELWLGHPEGTVAAVLAVGAVIAATRGRAGWAAVLLGLAIGTKEWAVIAAAPVLLTLPGQRRKVVLIAGAMSVLLCASVWVADPDALLRSLHGEGSSTSLNPLSLMWPLGSPVHDQPIDVRGIPFGLDRAGASLLMLTASLPPLALWYERARRRGARLDPLAMLAMLGVLRCAVDSTHLEYYWIAALIPLAVWEAGLNRAPLVTGLVTLRTWLLYGAIGQLAPNELYAISLVTKIAIIAYLAHRAMPVPSLVTRAPFGPRLSAAFAALWRPFGTSRAVAE